MNERELRILQRIIDSLRAIQQDIHAIYEKARSDSDEEHPPTQVDIQSEIRLPPAVNDYYESENTEGPRDRRRDRVRLWLEGIALGAAVLAAIFTFSTLKQVRRQADAAQDQLRNSEESFRLDERAWIEIERIDRVTISQRDGTFGAAFRYRLYPKNAGKTAAHAIMVSAGRGLQTSIGFESNADNMRRQQDTLLLLPSLPREARENPVPKVLAPATTVTVPFVMDGQEPQIFSKDEWVSYLIGRIDYIDAFGIKHWMKFCFYVADKNGELWNCHEGNEEDDNPETPPKPTAKR